MTNTIYFRKKSIKFWQINIRQGHAKDTVFLKLCVIAELLCCFTVAITHLQIHGSFHTLYWYISTTNTTRCSHVLSFIGYIILAKDTMDRQNGTWWLMRHLIWSYPDIGFFAPSFMEFSSTVVTIVKRETREPIENHVLIHHYNGVGVTFDCHICQHK